MATSNQGGEKLRCWLESERRSQAWLGEQIGTHQTNVSAWIRGRPIPLEMAVKIETITGIDVKEWVAESISGPSLSSTGTD
jgi:plasmid maintenance system antidote protein VapI